MREDPVDHRGLGDARDDPHGPATRRARQRVDLEDLLQQGRPPAGRLGRRQPGCGNHRGPIVRCGGRRLPPHAPRAIGIPAIVPRTSLRGSAWSLAAGLSVDVPFGASVTVSPEMGAVGGTVSSTLAQTNGRVLGRRGRVVNVTNTSGFSDAVRGWWGGVALGVRF